MERIAKAIGNALRSDHYDEDWVTRTEKERKALYIASIKRHIAWEEKKILRCQTFIKQCQQKIKDINA